MCKCSDAVDVRKFLSLCSDYVCEDCDECGGSGEAGDEGFCYSCWGRGVREFGIDDWFEWSGIPVDIIGTVGVYDCEVCQ